ncbi:MAG TPA: PaaI family thioesterase [Verrucomicrobiae bacterium]|nr:PaaI family thioesterase [Verrucomicrobiae bacterium]
MKELPHTHSCFVCGDANPLGLKLRFETDGRVVRTVFRPCAEHVGFKGVVHGGITATVLDEVMVWACAVATRRFAYCAELNVRYLQPLSPEVEMIVTGELVENRKGRIFEAKAAIQNGAAVSCVEARGKYLPIKARDVSQLVTDFVGDASWLQLPPR